MMSNDNSGVTPMPTVMAEPEMASAEVDMSRGIIGDMAAGDAPIPLTEMVDQSFFPRKLGQTASVRKPYRLAMRGISGVKLEWIQCAGMKCSTRSAWLRFCARLSGKTLENRDISGKSGSSAVA